MHHLTLFNVFCLSQRPLSSKMIVFFLEFGRVQAEQGALDQEEMPKDWQSCFICPTRIFYERVLFIDMFPHWLTWMAASNVREIVIFFQLFQNTKATVDKFPPLRKFTNLSHLVIVFVLSQSWLYKLSLMGFSEMQVFSHLDHSTCSHLNRQQCIHCLWDVCLPKIPEHWASPQCPRGWGQRSRHRHWKLLRVSILNYTKKGNWKSRIIFPSDQVHLFL